MATIESYVQPVRLYRYRSVDDLDREIGAIADGYLYCAAYTDLNDPMEGLFSSSQLLRESEDYRAIKNAIGENKAQIGMCSFSEVHDHELMWAHYADRFGGICIAYSLSKLLKHLPETNVSFVRIYYDERVPTVRRTDHEPSHLAKMVLSCKNYRWLYEREWRMFAPLGKDIFGRPEVNGVRVTTIYNVYRRVIGKLDLLENQLFASYTITRFLVLYLLREALEKDTLGKEFCLWPAQFLNSSEKRARLEECIDKVAQVVVRILDSEVKRRDADPSAPFDYKRELKSPNSVREIASTIVSHYQIAVDSKLATTFSDVWRKSKNGKRNGKRGLKNNARRNDEDCWCADAPRFAF